MKSIIGSFLKPPETSLQSTQSLAGFALSSPASSVQSETAARSEASSPDRREAPDSTGDAGIEDEGSSATPAPRERTRAPGLWYAGPSRFLMCVTTHKRKSLCPCENCNGKGLCVHKRQKHRYAQVWCVCGCVCYSLIPSPGAKPAMDRVSACTGEQGADANYAKSSKTGGATAFAG